MKTAILSLIAAGALAVTAGTADASPPRLGGFNRGYVRPVYPSYGYARPAYAYPVGGFYGSGYNSGFGLTIGRPGFGLTIGNAYPSYGYGSYYSRPYYGGWNGYGRRW